MSKDVKIPDIGGFDGVEVIDVLVSEGDTIAKEDSLITLESDKAAMDVPAPFAGKVAALKVKAGDKVSEGDVILTVEEDDDGDEKADEGEADKKNDDEEAKERDSDESEKDEDKESEEKTKDKKSKQRKEDPKKGKSKPKEQEKKSGKGEEEDQSKDEPEKEAEDEDERKGSKEKAKQPAREPEATPPIVDRISRVAAHAGPSVRKFARELGVDLSRVKGSGHKDRITHEDVKRFVKSALRGGAGAGSALPVVPEVDYSRFGEVETQPLSRIKKISGPRLQAAWINAPRVTQHDEADIGAIERVRKAMNEDAAEGDAKVTPLAFLVRAAVLALKAFPDANSALDATKENLIVRKYFHIGFAVDTEGGLVVPVIRDADQKSIREIAAELAALADKARSGKLKRDEIEGGCFSITSLGSIGGTAFTPIVNAPEVAILGVSRAEMKPKWNGEAFEPRLMLPLSLSYDHRVIDGATAVRITRHLARTLETLRGFVS